MRFGFVHPNCIVACWCRFLLRVLLLNWELAQHNNILSRALSFNHVRPSSWWGHIRWNLNVKRLPVREVFCSGFGVMETQNSYKGWWSACAFEISGMLKMGKVQGFASEERQKKSLHKEQVWGFILDATLEHGGLEKADHPGCAWKPFIFQQICDRIAFP